MTQAAKAPRKALFEYVLLRDNPPTADEMSDVSDDYTNGRLSRAARARFEALIRQDRRLREDLIPQMLLKELRDVDDADVAVLPARERAETRAAILHNHEDVAAAFRNELPSAEQLRLRERVWTASPLRARFPDLDIATMRFPDESRPSREGVLLERARNESLEDDRTTWNFERYYGFTLDELRSTDVQYRYVRESIIYGARGYALRTLTPKGRAHFEHWFATSRDFRVFTIPYLATAHFLYVRAKFLQDWDLECDLEPRHLTALRRAMSAFRFRQANDVEEARRVWAWQAAKLPLAAVDIRTGELLP